MRFLRAFLPSLLCAASALAQAKPVVEYGGNFGLHEAGGFILWLKYMEAEDRLLVVGQKSLQLIDLADARVVETRHVTLPLIYRQVRD